MFARACFRSLASTSGDWSRVSNVSDTVSRREIKHLYAELLRECDRGLGGQRRAMSAIERQDLQDSWQRTEGGKFLHPTKNLWKLRIQPPLHPGCLVRSFKIARQSGAQPYLGLASGAATRLRWRQQCADRNRSDLRSHVLAPTSQRRGYAINASCAFFCASMTSASMETVFADFR